MKSFLLLAFLGAASATSSEEEGKCGEICVPLEGPCGCNLRSASIDCKDEGLPTANLCAHKNYSTDAFKYVDLSQNNISFLQRRWVFDEIKSNVVKMDFANNRISDIENGTFDGFESLKELDFEKNRLNKLRPEMFRYLSTLRTLDLHDNYIEDLTTDPFRYITSLEYLYLDDNPLTDINDKSFSGLKNLVQLSLDNIRIDRLDSSWFADLVNLQTLSLQKNKLKIMPTLTLPSLQVFHISDNDIKEIHSYAFKGLPNLQELQIRYIKKLWVVHDCAFCSLSELDKLILAYCPELSAFSDGAFGDTLPKNIDLSNNALTTLNGAELRWEEVEDVQLQLNPWHCNCDLDWMRNVRHKQGLPAVCATPPHLKDKDIRLLQKSDLCPTSAQPILATLLIILLFVTVVAFGWYVWPGKRVFKDKCGACPGKPSLPYSYKNLSESDRSNLVGDDYLDSDRPVML